MVQARHPKGVQMPTTDLILSVQPETDVLHRVLSVCHRRRLAVTTLTYHADRLELSVDGDVSQSNRLSVWLAALPSVLGVVEVDGRDRSGCVAFGDQGATYAPSSPKVGA
jgi:hypothetical protein